MTTDEQLDPAPADAIENFQKLDVTQTGLNRFTVGDRDTGEGFVVSIGSEISCSCGFGEDGDGICAHAQYAIYKAPERVSADLFALRQVADLQTRFVDALERASQPAAAGGQSSGGGGGGGGDEEAEEPEPIDDPGDVAEGMIDSLDQWLPQAVSFDPDADEDAFDIEIVDLTWAEWQGEEGIWIDTAPFGTSYWDHDSNEWADKESYEAAREALTEVLQKRDEITYSGPPSYVNFIAEDDVDGVVG